MSVPRQQRSWWLGEAGALDLEPSLQGERSTDVCIVGGGFTGLWTALRIRELEPARQVSIVEADGCGAGASGRNGGFVMTLWHHFAGLARVCGPEEAVRLALASEDAVARIGEFCAEHAPEAAFRTGGWLWVATNPAQIGDWARTVDAIERQGQHPFQPASPEEVAERAGSRGHLAGIYEPASATVQPALLARALRRVALAQGVRIYERSPMVALERGAALRVRTPGGALRAGAVVIAMNAWSARLRELSRRFITVASDIVLTDPVPERLWSSGLRYGITMSDSRLMVHYYRPTPDGRLMFGKGGGRLAFANRVAGRYDGASPRAASVTDSMRALYPALADVPVAASWTGPVDRTIDGQPFFARLGRDDLVCGLGYSGNGVGPSALGGRILASLALGREDEYSRCGLVRDPPGGLPPEPVRYLGGRLVQGAVARKERAEDQFRSPSPLDRGLMRLAPGGLVGH